MSIASEITRLQNIKSNIRSALVSRGITEAASHDMADFAVDISNIQDGGAVLTITYNEEFYGKTITITNGEDTITEVAPNTGSLEVALQDEGVWTVSAPTQGKIFSIDVTVVLDYPVQLIPLPNGATVTPTDDIQTWLHCAAIWNKNYTAITEVLTDTTTLLTLISDDNAVDYMVRSTTWASVVCADSTAMTYMGANDYCANTLLSDASWQSAIYNSAYFENILDVRVPTMTGTDTPSGYAQNWKLYDNSSWRTTSPFNSSGAATTYYRFDIPVAINMFSYAGPGSSTAQERMSVAWTGYVDISDDGSNWTNIGSHSWSKSETYASWRNPKTYKLPYNSRKARYVRFRTSGTNYSYNNAVCIGMLQFYGRS